jgi:hypothetical protein
MASEHGEGITFVGRGHAVGHMIPHKVLFKGKC